MCLRLRRFLGTACYPGRDRWTFMHRISIIGWLSVYHCLWPSSPPLFVRCTPGLLLVFSWWRRPGCWGIPILVAPLRPEEACWVVVFVLGAEAPCASGLLVALPVCVSATVVTFDGSSCSFGRA